MKKSGFLQSLLKSLTPILCYFFHVTSIQQSFKIRSESSARVRVNLENLYVSDGSAKFNFHPEDPTSSPFSKSPISSEVMKRKSFDVEGHKGGFMGPGRVHNDDLCPIRICKVNFSRVGWWTPQFISVTEYTDMFSNGMIFSPDPPC